MRVPRAAAVAMLGAAAFCVSAPVALADSSGQIEVAPHVVHPGEWVQVSTEDCHHSHAAKVYVDIDQVKYTIWLNHHTDEGLTGWFWVPRDTDPGTYGVEGHCVPWHSDDSEHVSVDSHMSVDGDHHGREIEGSFVVKHDCHEGEHGHHKHHHHHHHHDDHGMGH